MGRMRWIILMRLRPSTIWKRIKNKRVFTNRWCVRSLAISNCQSHNNKIVRANVTTDSMDPTNLHSTIWNLTSDYDQMLLTSNYFETTALHEYHNVQPLQLKVYVVGGRIFADSRVLASFPFTPMVTRLLHIKFNANILKCVHVHGSVQSHHFQASSPVSVFVC